MSAVDRFQETVRRFVEWVGSRPVRDRIQRLIEAQPFLENVPYWVAATLVGLVAVWYAEAIEFCTQTVHEVYAANPVLLFGLSPLCFLTAWWIVHRYAPSAGGSGIPAVKASINLDVKSPRRYLERLANSRISLVKIASSLLCVIGGGPVGREGPTIQISASIFLLIGGWFRKVWPKSTHQPWLIAGGAAGLAAAFNTPLGGIVFAIEELAVHSLNRFKTVLISAVIISGMVAQWIWGSYLFIGYPQLGHVAVSFTPWAIIIGVVCGVGGGFFGKLIWSLRSRIRTWTVRRQALYAAGAGLFVAAYAYFVTDHIFGGGSQVIKELLFSEAVEADWKMTVARYVGTVVTYVTGVAGGIFAPSLAIGAAMGSQIAVLVGSEYANLMVLVGMASFLSAVTRAPFTAMVLVIEMTDRHAAAFQLMLATTVAYVVALSIDPKSFYQRSEEAFIEEIRRMEEQRSV